MTRRDVTPPGGDPESGSGFAPPTDTLWTLLLADERSLPAVATILESLPPNAIARVFAQVAESHEDTALTSAANFQVTWLRDGGPSSHSRMADAVRAMRWPDGPAYVWGRGEACNLVPVQQYLRDELGLPPERVDIVPR